MSDITYRNLIVDGLWHNNQALVALLGLCPLLAVSNTAINGLSLGLATTAVLVTSNTTVSLIRNFVRPEVRLPVFVLVIASFVTAIELGMNAYFHELHKILGIFIPLIVTNCTIIGRAEAFASKNNLRRSLVDGISIGIGFILVLLVLGGMRELVGQGTLFDQAHLMFGEAARGWTLKIENFRGMLVTILPPGAFIGLGLLIMVKNLIDKHLATSAMAKTEYAEEIRSLAN
ncbi:MAG: electron transport complex subunit E [Candidatus Thiodiazotropha sp. (ex Lucinoma aequizonata)]|nr:electron transport complex subunit E [Candidatus Thiodiazotropha sp. (ex Lucinoma aequizonata)]MCU7888689.1 electron transport complex subunit E [Candidatus Thiodiazotropha sp. (ex Lucinoma aequizonata)]MCU7895952.1 electron transport complex subunit E [Candidatus Thiodiazotropha sp. (ex Lucinoma aequizonata)]MCU7900548.1 electron transport complex subunit E [Candidatus Thiodiazotropha sp. (ex Lucinoma aequizonata)]MCU7904164.1 electron transport complex subunit E [Candidatus Thiodiazotropha